MKLIWTILIGLAVAILAILAMEVLGLADIHWQQIATGLGVLAGPFKYLFSQSESTKEKIQGIRQEHQQARAREDRFQEKLTNTIRNQEKRVEEFQQKVEDLDQQMDQLEKRADTVKEQVENMGVKKKKEKARELFGEF